MSKHHPAPQTIRTTPTPWQEVVLVCRKCSRKLDGGFGADGDEKLRSVLKQALRGAGRRRGVRVLETGCFSVCPKRAVSVMRAARPGEILVVPEGTEPMAILERMGLPSASLPPELSPPEPSPPEPSPPEPSPPATSPPATSG